METSIGPGGSNTAWCVRTLDSARPNAGPRPATTGLTQPCSYRLSSPSGRVATGTILSHRRRRSRAVLPERQQGWIPSQQRIELAGDVPLQTPQDLFLRQAFSGAPVDVGSRRRVPAHPPDSEQVQRPIGVAVTTPVEPVAVGLTGRGGDGSDAAQVGEGALTPQAVGVV